MSSIGHRRVAAANAFADAIAAGDHALRHKAYIYALRVAMALECDNKRCANENWSDLAILELVRRPLLVDECHMVPANLRERVQRNRKPSDLACCVAVGGRRQWCCSGTVVAPNVVVSAGHGLDRFEPTRVFIGSDWRRLKDGLVISVRRCVRHQNYNFAACRHDIMVLILAEDVPSHAIGKLACTTAINNAVAGRVVGYGSTAPNSTEFGKRTTTNVTILDNLHSPTQAQRFGHDPNRELVAGGPPAYADSCVGDSGGPLEIQYGGGWQLAAISSRGVLTNNRKLVTGMGGIYVRLDKYLKFLQSVPGGKWK